MIFHDFQLYKPLATLLVSRRFCLTCIWLFLVLLTNIWLSSLRGVAIKIDSGQQGCGARTCGLFD